MPELFKTLFPSWFAGFAFAAIAIGALVPAAVMSIGSANLFTRNFWKAYVNPEVTPAGEAQVAKIASLVVKIGAAAGDPLSADAVRARPAAARQHVDHADAAGADLRLVHPLVYRAGAADRLGWWVLPTAPGSCWMDGLKPLHLLTLGRFQALVYIGLLALMVNVIVATWSMSWSAWSRARSRRRNRTSDLTVWLDWTIEADRGSGELPLFCQLSRPICFPSAWS